MIGKSLTIKGELKFEKLLKVEGSFEGSLISNGSVIVTKTGRLVADINKMKDVCIEGGHVTGNIDVERVMISGAAVVVGNIKCKTLSITAGVRIKGTLDVAEA